MASTSGDSTEGGRRPRLQDPVSRGPVLGYAGVTHEERGRWLTLVTTVPPPYGVAARAARFRAQSGHPRWALSSLVVALCHLS